MFRGLSVELSRMCDDDGGLMRYSGVSTCVWVCGGVALSVVFFVLVKSLLLKAFKNDRNPLKHMFVI